MKSKLHFGILVLLFAFLGTYLEHTTVPNQQILIEFSKENISSSEAKSTLNDIKTKLQHSGASLIQIGHNQNGELRITYFSNADVEHIQSILTLEQRFNIAYKQDSKNSRESNDGESSSSYELNISEIKDIHSSNSDFDGIQVTEFNQKTDRYNGSKVNTSALFVQLKYLTNLNNVSFKVTNGISNTKVNQSYKIPEVRAGPSSIGII